MLALVTGSTGLVGNNLVRTLLARGEEVRVLVRQGSAPEPLAGLDVERVYGDVRERAVVRDACRGADLVVHAAAHVQFGWSKRELHDEINVAGTRNVAEAARDGAARMVHVSSVDTLGIRSREEPADEETPRDGHVDCPYVLSKRAAEDEVLRLVDEGLDAVIVNPAYVLGAWDWKPSSGRMLLQVASGRGVLAPSGGNDFCDVRDVCAGILAAAEQGRRGRRYILGGEPLSYYDAWSLFAEVSGARRPLGTAAGWMVKSAGLAGDLWTRIVGSELDVNSAATAVSMLPHHFCSDRARAELGYRPRSAREAARHAWSWFVDRGYARAANATISRGARNEGSHRRRGDSEAEVTGTGISESGSLSRRER